MRTRHLLPALLLGAGLLGLAALPAPAADSGEAKKIARLIEQLGSDAYADRQKANEALDQIGEPALDALRKATSSKDAEVRKRSADLVDRIERRLGSARALRPTAVHLAYKDTPVATIVADLAKKTGYNVVLHDPAGKLKDRKITLDTGKTTFWSALEQLCAKAGLVEGDPNTAPFAPPPLPPGVRPPVPVPLPAPAPPGVKVAPAPPPPPPRAPAPGKVEKKAEKKEAEAKKAEEAARKAKEAAEAAARARELVKRAAVARAGVVMAGKVVALGPAVGVRPVPPGGFGGGAPGGFGGFAPPGMPGRVWVNVQPGQITLMPGKAAGPSDTATAVRVRLADKRFWGGPAPASQLRIVLEVSPEPKLRWQRLASIGIDKAIDNNDQKLSAEMAPMGVPGAFPGAPIGGAVFPGGAMPVWRGRGGFGGPFMYSASGLYHQATVFLKKGDKESRSLKELSGTISAQVLGPAEQMIVATDVTKVGGKAAKGAKGGAIKVTAVAKQPNGAVQITFEFDMPAGVVPETQIAVPAVNVPAPGFRIRPGVRPLPPAPAGAPPVKGKVGVGVARPAIAFAAVKPVAGGGAMPAIGIAVPGGMMMPAMGHAPFGLTLRDDKGNILPAAISPNWRKAGGIAVPGAGGKAELIAVYQPAVKGAPAPAKLVFTARRSIDVNIPFKLTNIDLK